MVVVLSVEAFGGGGEEWRRLSNDCTCSSLAVCLDVGSAGIDFRSIERLAAPSTFSEPVSDLVEVKKAGVFIARALFFLGWAASISIEGMGLELRFKSHVERKADGIGKGEGARGDTRGAFSQVARRFPSRVARRDWLFLRLISLGQQKWGAL